VFPPGRLRAIHPSSTNRQPPDRPATCASSGETDGQPRRAPRRQLSRRRTAGPPRWSRRMTRYHGRSPGTPDSRPIPRAPSAGRSAKQLIDERGVLDAKRILAQTGMTVLDAPGGQGLATWRTSPSSFAHAATSRPGHSPHGRRRQQPSPQPTCGPDDHEGSQDGAGSLTGCSATIPIAPLR
jgi:hypothetical protein